MTEKTKTAPETTTPKTLRGGDPCPCCCEPLSAYSPSGRGSAACDHCQLVFGEEDETTTTKTPITITYTLDADGRKAAILAGLSGAARQTLTVDQDDPGYERAFERAEVDYDGQPVLDLTRVEDEYGAHWGGWDEPQTAEQLCDWLDARDEARREQRQAEEERRTEQERAELARHRSEAEEWLGACPIRWLGIPEVVALRVALDDPRRDPNTHWREGDLGRARAAVQRGQEAEAKAAEEAEEARAAAERGAWIEAHGSARLRRCVAERIECDGIYRDERLALEREGWSYGVPGGRVAEPRNPPVEALDLLDRARLADPRATLVYASGTSRDGGRWSGYYASAEFLGRPIMLTDPVCYTEVGIDDEE